MKWVKNEYLLHVSNWLQDKLIQIIQNESKGKVSERVLKH